MLDKSTKTAGRVLLPSYVKPEKYDLRIVPNLTEYTFDGIVTIDMSTGQSFTDDEAKKITLHSKEIMYRSAEFQTAGGKVVAAEEVGLLLTGCAVGGFKFVMMMMMTTTIIVLFCFDHPIVSQIYDSLSRSI
jgi:hypothetical protein